MMKLFSWNRGVLSMQFALPLPAWLFPKRWDAAIGAFGFCGRGWRKGPVSLSVRAESRCERPTIIASEYDVYADELVCTLSDGTTRRVAESEGRGLCRIGMRWTGKHPN